TISGGDLAGLNGVVGLNLNSPSIIDLAGNALPNTEPLTDETYTVGNTVQIFNFSTTPSGFTVNFNSVLAVTPLNLYDSNSGALGPADVTLVGNTTGAVRGSLILSPDHRQATFVATGGPLAADTYTVTLRSASNGFQDTAGELLDGNSDGTVGDDYTNTFVIASGPANEVLVSIPDFARGYGQAVDLPTNADSGIPITLNTGQNVTEVDLDLVFDPTLLTIMGFSTNIPGAASTFNLLAPGLVRITVSSATDFSTTPGTIELGRFAATVPDSAPYASKHVLRISSLHVEDSVPQTRPSRADDGMHVAAFAGDSTGNQAYSSGDTTLLQRIIAGSGTGPVAFQLADPMLLMDLNRGGTITSGDATLMQRVIVGTPVVQIPPLPTGITPPAPGGPDPRLFIPTDLTGVAGATVTVPVNLLVTEPSGVTVSGMNLAIAYDHTKFTVDNFRMGSLLGEGFAFSTNTSTPGIIRVTLATDFGPDLAFGDVGPVFEFDFTVYAGAATGGSTINLLQNFSTTVTQVTDNDINELTLVPAPTNADSDSVDGLFTIDDAVVPADLTGNGFVDFQDLSILLANWNRHVSAAEGNLVDPESTPVNFQDLTVLLAGWTGPGPTVTSQAAVAEATAGGVERGSSRDTTTTERRAATNIHFDRLGQRERVTLRRVNRTNALSNHTTPTRRLQAAAVDRAMNQNVGAQGENSFARSAGRSRRGAAL
ncbi:MAG: hypothetical protein IIA67_00115, partial [Planctomycetes bacterium]|nr:hypothetical protein [Planctomycetota bacterium]